MAWTVLLILPAVALVVIGALQLFSELRGPTKTDL